MMTTPASYSSFPAPGPPPADPPRRRFGSGVFPASTSTGPRPSPGSGRPSSSSSGSGSTTSLTLTPNALLSPAAIEPQRARSFSSASSKDSATPVQGAAAGGPAFDITLAADKAQQWLSTWAPKGEGRGREFLNNTLNGVASVASTVSSGLNARHDSFGENSRRRSFVTSTSSPSAGPSPSTSPEGVRTTSFFSNNPPPPPLSNGPLQSFSTSQLDLTTNAGTTRKIPQPANLSRLGHANTTAPTVTLSSTTNPTPPGQSFNRPAISQSGSTTSLPATIPRSSSTSAAPTLNLPSAPHGPSHLNPNASTSGHTRTLSGGNGSFHSRSPSFGMSISKSPSLSRSSSLATRSGPSTRSAGMPYKIGFQPAGVRADRTGDFMEARRLKGEDREKEEGRLGRRWAKLVDLHFNPTIPATTQLPIVPTLTRSSSSTFSLSSLTDKRRSLLSIDGALDALKPKELLKGFKAPSASGGSDEGRKRAAEQAIVKWEDDGEAKKCRICQSTFSLSNRKHHCRLCGRIVCSLPPTPPALLAVQIQLFAPVDPTAMSNSQAGLPPGTRREKCSLLLVADWKTGRGEEVEEGFVGWMKMEDGDEVSDQGKPNTTSVATSKRDKRKSRLSGASVASTIREGEKDRDVPLPQQPKEVQVKGVRVCRECWGVVARKQKMQDRQRVTGFARLYQALRALQAEIEDLVPEFEDQLAELTESPEVLAPTPEMLSTHKQLLTLFTQYEHLSKRISSLTCEEGGSQATVQSAVARTAAGFMAKEMVKLQALPKLQKRAADAKRKSMAVMETTLSDHLRNNDGIGMDEQEIEDVAVMLQPLLEQEAQLELYIADANAQRKYEDGKALAEALKDIRAEIQRVTLSATASR